MTMNDTWGFKSYDKNWKSAEVLVHNLIDITSKGGNYLLNVGPTASGLIPNPSISRLEKMGEWLDINGEAIYSSEKLKKDYKQGEYLRFTKKNNLNSYFAIALKKPENSITINNIEPNKNSSIYLLGYDEPLIWSFDTKRGLEIQVPKSIPGEIAWTFKILGKEI
jgi:alpha-L-fucosidase